MIVHIQKESCLDETDDVNTVYEIITCTEIKEMLNPDYDDVMVFTNKQVDVTYDDIIQCTKERVNPDFEDMTLAKKEMNVEYDIIIASDSEDSSECRQDQQVNCSYRFIRYFATYISLYE